MIELVDQLALVHDIRKPDRGGAIDELKGHLPLWMQLPDHLEHQQLIEIRVEQRANRRIDVKGVIIDAGRDIRGHCASLRRRAPSDKCAHSAGSRTGAIVRTVRRSRGPGLKPSAPPQESRGTKLVTIMGLIRRSAERAERARRERRSDFLHDVASSVCGGARRAAHSYLRRACPDSGYSRRFVDLFGCAGKSSPAASGGATSAASPARPCAGPVRQLGEPVPAGAERRDSAGAELPQLRRAIGRAGSTPSNPPPARRARFRSRGDPCGAEAEESRSAPAAARNRALRRS